MVVLLHRLESQSVLLVKRQILQRHRLTCIVVIAKPSALVRHHTDILLIFHQHKFLEGFQVAHVVVIDFIFIIDDREECIASTVSCIDQVMPVSGGREMALRDSAGSAVSGEKDMKDVISLPLVGPDGDVKVDEGASRPVDDSAAGKLVDAVLRSAQRDEISHRRVRASLSESAAVEM